jgi:hypothetical protein
VAVLGKNSRSRLCVVGAGRATDRTVGGGTDNPVLEGRGKLGGVVVDVPTSAKQDVRNAGVGERGFSGSVLLADEQRRGGGMGDARVSDQLRARGFRGGDHIGVLSDALPSFGAGHEEKSSGAVECLTEGRPVGVVGAAYGNALVSEVAQRLDAATGSDDLLSWEASAS